jgi:hypothetical protein
MPAPVFLLTTLLRVGGSVLSLAAVAMLLPRETMVATNLRLGLEPLVETPLVLYLARTTSALYALRGLSYFVAASDPVRYRPFIVFIGATNVAFGVALGAIGVTAGMPAWWTALESPFVIGTGILLLVLVRWVPRERGA